MVLTNLTHNIVGPLVINSGGLQRGPGATQDKQSVMFTLQRLINSSSYWEVEVQDVTGSQTEALVLRPKQSLTATPNLRIVATMNISGVLGGVNTVSCMQDRTAGTPDTATAGALLMGFTPDVSPNPTWVVGSWNSDRPWGNTVRWSKYWSGGLLGTLTSVDQMYLIESTETLWVGVRSRRNVSYGIGCGAYIVSPYALSGETDGRVWTMTAVSSTAMANGMNQASTQGPFGHQANANDNHCGVFIVSGGNAVTTPSTGSANANYFELAFKGINSATTQQGNSGDRGSNTTSEETVVGMPVPMVSQGATKRFIGFLRQIEMTNDYPSLLPLATGTNAPGIVGITLSSDCLNANDSLVFRNDGQSSLVLPRLNWRLISPQRPATVSGSDIIATVKSQVVNSCSYWQLVESANTGSNSILLKPRSAFSTSSNCNVVLAYNVTGTNAYRSPDTGAPTAQYKLQIGMTPDITENGSGSFKGPNADRPFQVSGDPRWSGYWHCAATGSVSASFILESEDSIFIGFRTNLSSSGTMGALAGNIIETIDSGSGENNMRLYGMVTSGPTSISTAFWATNTSFLGNTNSADSNHAGVFTVSGSRTQSDTQWSYAFKLSFTDVGSPSIGDYSTWNNTAAGPAGSRQIGFPVAMNTGDANDAAPFRLLGVLRGIYHGADEFGLAQITSGSTTVAYKLPTSWSGYQDAALFAPASGSSGLI